MHAADDAPGLRVIPAALIRFMSPLVDLTYWFRHAREVLILHPKAPVLKAGTRVEDLKVVKHKFSWQGDGESLVDFHRREAVDRNAKVIARHKMEVELYAKQKKQLRQILDGEKNMDDEDVEELVKDVLDYFTRDDPLIEECGREDYGMGLEGLTREDLGEENKEEKLLDCLGRPCELEKESEYVKEVVSCEVVELDAGKKNVGDVYGFLGEAFKGGGFVF